MLPRWNAIVGKVAQLTEAFERDTGCECKCRYSVSQRPVHLGLEWAKLILNAYKCEWMDEYLNLLVAAGCTFKS